MTLWQTRYAVEIPKKGGVQEPRAKTGLSPGSHSSEGWVRLPAGLVRPPPVLLENVWPQKQNTRGKRKHRQEKPKENPCRLASQEKGLRRFKENPKNRAGPRMATPKNHQEAGRTAKTGRNRQKRRDTKKKTGTSKTSAGEGVSCHYLNCI